MSCKARSHLIAATFAVVTAMTAGSFPLSADVSATAARLGAAQTALATRLIDKLAANNPAANVVVSPASLAGVLAVIEFGADEQLRRNLHQVLGFGEASEASIDFDGLRKATGRPRRDGPLATANAIFFDTHASPRPEAIEALNEAGVRASVEDFAKPDTLAAINNWVSEQTKGKIPTVLDKMPDVTGLVALNALYFKDRWKQPFEVNATKLAPFRLVGGKVIEIPLMRAGDRQFRFRRDNRFIAVDLPYASEGYSLVVITTRREPAAAKDFSAVGGWLTGEGFFTALGEVALPKFNASSSFDLMPALKALGLKLPNTLPGFARGPLRLAKAQQRVELTIDEEGTEAAAATAVTTTRSSETEFIKFSADKPFMFALRDQSGLIVLAGYIASPKTGAAQTSEAPAGTQ
jgi:serine protease inhibitor